MPISPIGRTIAGVGFGLGNPVSRTGNLSGAAPAVSRQDAESRFVQTLSQAINDIEGLQKTADNDALSLLANGQTELHQAVIATEKAQLALQFALQVRNKVIEAYQEVMRMQV